MKISVAQAKPESGNIEKNIVKHLQLIGLAKGADLIVFPELSLTGYEPALAGNLATDIDDKRLEAFQTISDKQRITICVGLPIKQEEGVSISMVIIQPHEMPQLYSKTYLHTDEEPFFVSHQNDINLTLSSRITFAICYELSVSEHTANAFKNGENIYIASVSKTKKGIDKTLPTLAGIASTHKATVLLSNAIGTEDGGQSAGHSSAWDNKGVLLGQMNEVDEGVIVIDTDTHETVIRKLWQ
ncbi:carbon-nitrogen hydrolase family protein [Pinibacter aurantiacus]|uniref:Carbon-nitrogen hydrolase family protein n=1 Tax=Pinibacter aurantiacus TaxID=2851599 RepID=A0A9E2SEL7_9BACT|nr:carbon-nitrogen hydrolase family protein [Pinibacter aurantiacus]MBV4358660.1 carbon-nitrogen hydrolase family protein [Pinibacter aurantiacus]